MESSHWLAEKLLERDGIAVRCGVSLVTIVVTMMVMGSLKMKLSTKAIYVGGRIGQGRVIDVEKRPERVAMVEINFKNSVTNGYCGSATVGAG